MFEIKISTVDALPAPASLTQQWVRIVYIVGFSCSHYFMVYVSNVLNIRDTKTVAEKCKVI